MDFPVYRFSSAFVYHCEYKWRVKKRGDLGGRLSSSCSWMTVMFLDVSAGGMVH